MDTGKFHDYIIESSLIKDYNEIKLNLKEYFIKIGLDFGWKVIDTSGTKIKFQSKSDLKTMMTSSHQEHIIIDFSDRKINVHSKVSFDNTWKVPFVDKTEKWNEENCRKVINEIPKLISNYLNSEFEIKRKQEKEQRREEFIKKENDRIENLKLKQNELLSEFDFENPETLNMVDGDTFDKLVSKNQDIIIGKNELYIQKFVKISLYLKIKRNNTKKIFDKIRSSKSDDELNEIVGLFKNQIHTYNLLVFHSINMVTSLIENDLITFYQIYECFDNLGVFNTSWENDISNKLTDIKNSIRDLMYSIYKMEEKIINSIENLSYMTQDSFENLSNSVEIQLSNLNSSIKFNTLLTGIQTYQMYKINQNTKRIG